MTVLRSTASATRLVHTESLALPSLRYVLLPNIHSLLATLVHLLLRHLTSVHLQFVKEQRVAANLLAKLEKLNPVKLECAQFTRERRALDPTENFITTLEDIE
ncbi:unnamed protein product [Protopolystoma xenopodis]|uniref:Uncharacterized protein n=1 Tax=Protopolystoma xenopodis TaxID=117903 RepID=A0A448WZG7_9PLAT|nr:unnamed protein product [Protopolystoma xenopodis]